MPVSVFRTLLASSAILVAGIATLAAATDGFRAYTTESARRLGVQAQPRDIPGVAMRDAAGRRIDFAQLRGRWVLVDFIYTRCLTYCSVQGSEFARLQQRLARPIAEGRVVLLSISFDPRDDSAALAAYQQRSGDHGAGWVAARPLDMGGLATLLHVFGVTAVPDAAVGFVHNAAINIVDPSGRLVAIVDWDHPQAAEHYLRARLAR